MFAVVYSAGAMAPAILDPEIGINLPLMVHGGQEFAWSEPVEIPYAFDAYQRGNLTIQDGIVHLAYSTYHESNQQATVWHATYTNDTWTTNIVGALPDIVSRLALDVTAESLAACARNSLGVSSGSQAFERPGIHASFAGRNRSPECHEEEVDSHALCKR